MRSRQTYPGISHGSHDHLRSPPIRWSARSGAAWKPPSRPCASAARGCARATFGSADLDTWIGRADDALLAPIEGEMGYFDCRNNRLARLALDCNEFRARVAVARRRFGAGRIALLLGTSTSGILSTEEAFRRVDPESGALPAALQLHGHPRHELAGGLRRPRAGSRTARPWSVPPPVPPVPRCLPALNATSPPGCAMRLWLAVWTAFV